MERFEGGGRSPRARFPKLHIKPFEQFEGSRTFTNFIEPLLPKKLSRTLSNPCSQKNEQNNPAARCVCFTVRLLIVVYPLVVVFTARWMLFTARWVLFTVRWLLFTTRWVLFVIVFTVRVCHCSKLQHGVQVKVWQHTIGDTSAMAASPTRRSLTCSSLCVCTLSSLPDLYLAAQHS